MNVQFIGGAADGQFLYVSVNWLGKLPSTYHVYNVATKLVDWYELKRDQNGAPFYQYVYSIRD